MSGPEHSSRADADVDRLRAERDALREQVEALQARRRRGGALRRAAVVALVVLACLSLTAATVAVWANRTLLTTDGWVETVGPLADEPAVATALQPRITEAVFAAIPAQELLADALPEDRAFLSVPLSAAIQSFVDDQVGAFLASDAYPRLWVGINETAHERALAVLRGESDLVETEGDAVTLNLLPVVNGVLGQLSDVASDLIGQDVSLPTLEGGELPEDARAQLGDALGVDLQEGIGEIPVYDADELIAAQQALRLFDQALLLLVVATPLLVVAAVWLSRNRRATVLQLALGSVLLLVVVRRVVLRFQETVVALPPRTEGQAAAEVVTEQIQRGLFDLTGVAIAAALVIVAIALLTGPYGWAVALRRGSADLGRRAWTAGSRMTAGDDGGGLAAWTTAHRQALQIGGVLLVVAVVLLLPVSWGWFLTLLVALGCWELLLWRLGDGGASGAPP